VVASGQFLIDSEASLKSVLPRFAGEQGSASAQTPANAGLLYHGVGKVEKVAPGALTISHKPIPELKWGVMTMDFNKPRAGSFAGVAVGQDIEFSFKAAKEGYVLESVTPAGGGKK
jgi:Cu(I)/Ag(I) efflux system membrane fusion protein